MLCKNQGHWYIIETISVNLKAALFLFDDWGCTVAPKIYYDFNCFFSFSQPKLFSVKLDVRYFKMRLKNNFVLLSSNHDTKVQNIYAL